MMSPESREPTVFAIAGQTSTGKTRLGEGMVGQLQEQGYSACVMSVGDIFRLLTMHIAVKDDPEAMQDAVQETLLHAHVAVDGETGRVHLHYNGESFKQTYENGNSAALLTLNPAVIYQVSHFIEDRITNEGSRYDFVGLDGRERRGADVLFRTYADPATRVAIRRIEQPEGCMVRSDEEIYADITKRDDNERSFVEALLLDDVNVVHIERRTATPEANQALIARAAGVLVDFKTGVLPPNFGTISIHS
jgi:cytidylate kinase